MADEEVTHPADHLVVVAAVAILADAPMDIVCCPELHADVRCEIGERQESSGPLLEEIDVDAHAGVA